MMAALSARRGSTDYNTSKFNLRDPGAASARFNVQDVRLHPAAIEAGLDTEDVRYDEPVVIDGWPRNYDEGYRGRVTLRTAFALFDHTVAMKSPTRLDKRVADVARRLGVHNMPERNVSCHRRSRSAPSETNLWDMVSAFGAYSKWRFRVDPAHHRASRIPGWPRGFTCARLTGNRVRS